MSATITTTETDFRTMFSTLDHAKQFEDQALSAGREYLPPCAVAVLDGTPATSEYWAWLCDQALLGA
jgi:hypothetical protein